MQQTLTEADLLRCEVTRLRRKNNALMAALARADACLEPAAPGRLLACVGACVGLPTQALEAGALWDVIEGGAGLLRHLAQRGALLPRPDPVDCPCPICRLERGLLALGVRAIPAPAPAGKGAPHG